jgi:hypothetical protein
VVYAVAEDLEDQRSPHPLLRAASFTANLQRHATPVTPPGGITTVDITPPAWHDSSGGVSGGTPTATAVTSTVATVVFALSEPGQGGH